jgi:hypothetical protein
MGGGGGSRGGSRLESNVFEAGGRGAAVLTSFRIGYVFLRIIVDCRWFTSAY